MEIDGRRFAPSQTNNAYVFPGVGLGVTATGARRVTDEMLLAAAEALSEQADEATLRTGALLPPLERIREVSLRIALAVARVVIEAGLAGREHARRAGAVPARSDVPSGLPTLRLKPPRNRTTPRCPTVRGSSCGLTVRGRGYFFQASPVRAT